MLVTELGKMISEGCSFDGDHGRPAIICGQDGDLVNAKLVSMRVVTEKQCELRPMYGVRGVRVCEASHPGPVQTRNARRLLST